MSAAMPYTDEEIEAARCYQRCVEVRDYAEYNARCRGVRAIPFTDRNRWIAKVDELRARLDAAEEVVGVLRQFASAPCASAAALPGHLIVNCLCSRCVSVRALDRYEQAIESSENGHSRKPEPSDG